EHSQNNRILQKQTEGMNSVEHNPKTTDNERLERLGNKDQASLSERAKILAKAYTTFQDQTDIRSEKVDALREAINNGNYQIPVEQLAAIFVKGFRS
ncbi:MAG: flagellar biosynthesis anti-sigma factor FlgM, partial [Anaerolineales bacterium]